MRDVYLASASQLSARHLPGMSHVQMMARVGAEALDLAGLRPDDIDGVFACSGPGGLEVAEFLGILPEFVDTTMLGGASSLSHVAHAAALISAGMADHILVTHSGRNGSMKRDGTPPTTGVWSEEFQVPFAVAAPMGLFALAATAHMDRYGTTSEQFAEVAVATRRWAALNDEATFREEITVKDVLSSRVVCEPLHLLDCCLVTDAAGAVVVTASPSSSGGRAVRVAGTGQAHTHVLATQWPDLTTTAAGDSANRALRRAEVTLADVDVLQLYDATTSQVVIMLEDIGFCGKGEGGDFVTGGRTAPGGDLPMNTQGGALSFTHPGMFGIFTVIEAYRQVARQYAGTERQVDAEVALAHGIGYSASTHASIVLTAA